MARKASKGQLSAAERVRVSQLLRLKDLQRNIVMVQVEALSISQREAAECLRRKTWVDKVEVSLGELTVYHKLPSRLAKNAVMDVLAPHLKKPDA